MINSPYRAKLQIKWITVYEKQSEISHSVICWICCKLLKSLENKSNLICERIIQVFELDSKESNFAIRADQGF